MIAVVTSTVVYMAAPSLVTLFTHNGFIQETTVTYLRLITWVYPLIAVALPTGRILQGFGLGLPTLVITLIRVLLVATPLSWYFIFIQNKPVEWVWYAMMGSAVVAFIVSISWVFWAIKKYSLQPMRKEHGKIQLEPNQ